MDEHSSAATAPSSETQPTQPATPPDQAATPEPPDPTDELHEMARNIEPTAHVILRGHGCPVASAFLRRLAELA